MVWQKIITNFQILSFLYKYFIESRYKLLYELTVTSMFNVGTCKVRNEIETKRKRTKRNEIKRNGTKPIETKRNEIKRNWCNITLSNFSRKYYMSRNNSIFFMFVCTRVLCVVCNRRRRNNMCFSKGCWEANGTAVKAVRGGPPNSRKYDF